MFVAGECESCDEASGGRGGVVVRSCVRGGRGAE